MTDRERQIGAIQSKEVPMFRLALTVALALAPALAHAGETPVTTLVVVKTPPGVTRAQVEAGFKQAVPTYQKVPGLIRKYFTVNDAGFGGMYLWESRAAAEAWYSPAWQQSCKARYGVDCQLTYFDSPVQIDGMASAK
jgi:hypothetical protein